jgi:hypothetical protein
MPRHCRAMVNDRLVAEREMQEGEMHAAGAPSTAQPAHLLHFSTFHVSSDCTEITSDEQYSKRLAARAAARASGGGGGAGDGAGEGEREREMFYEWYQWAPELVSVQITVHENCGVREHAADTHELSKLVATLFEGQSRPGRCQIDIGLEAAYGRLVQAARRGEAGPRVSHDTLQKLVVYICRSLLGYSKEAVTAAVAAGLSSSAPASASSQRDEDAWQGWYAGHLKVFSNDFRFAETTAVVLREGEARLLVALEGDAARQPFYREGNGLNVGLYGALDLAHLLPFAASPEALSSDAGGAALLRRRALGAAMSQFVFEDSIRLSAFETLIPSRETESMLRRVVESASPGKEDSFAGWSDYEWRDMRSQDRILWGTLGWNEEVWEREAWIGNGEEGVFCPLPAHGYRSFQDLTQAQKDAVEKLRINPDARTRTHAMWRLCESRVWETRMAWNSESNTLVLLVFLLLALPALALLPVVVCANVFSHLRPKPSNKVCTRGFKAAELASRPASECTSNQHQHARLLASKLADHKSNAGIQKD